METINLSKMIQAEAAVRTMKIPCKTGWNPCGSCYSFEDMISLKLAMGLLMVVGTCMKKENGEKAMIRHMNRREK